MKRSFLRYAIFKVYFSLLLLVFSSCNKIQENCDSSKFDVQTLAANLTNKDHALAFENGSNCYAKYINSKECEIYIVDKNESLAECKRCCYIKNSKKNKIAVGMNKTAVTSLLGEPAVIIGDRYIYFQKSVSIMLLSGNKFLDIDYGIDRRIFKIYFENDNVTRYNEEYVSRP